MTKEKKLYLTAGFLSIVSILLGFIAFSIIIVCTPLHTLLLKGNSTHEYKLYDYEDPIVPIIEDPNQVSLLKDFHSALESFPEYTFLEKINQSLDIQYFCGSESFAPDNINIFEHDGTNYITVNQLLLNKEAFNAERIPLHCGNGFDETSYIVSPDYHISVILGSNYLKYFNIGDVISALNYYEVPTYMVVQGFAEKGACATVNGVTIDLDNYIITASPLFNFMPESFDETRYHGLLYFQKLCLGAEHDSFDGGVLILEREIQMPALVMPRKAGNLPTDDQIVQRVALLQYALCQPVQAGYIDVVGHAPHSLAARIEMPMALSLANFPGTKCAFGTRFVT